ncbi:uncharacterized protein LOC143280351 [Babylonia areolata]|uniref:uncharacterized protein LOC143280351 n=1 Tax=Babylonia areolata TaxID=304850 RepID=UPI003FD072EC
MESLMSPPLDPTSLLVGGAVGLLSLLWWLSTRRPPGLPPGPGPALPLLGHLHLMPKDPRAQLWTWRRQYGDVFSLYMGGTLVVVLASYSAIREALVTFADVFSHRPHSFLMAKISNNKGDHRISFTQLCVCVCAGVLLLLFSRLILLTVKRS